MLVRQLVRDFGLPVRIVTVPTVREPDGLALSSRNAYLDPSQRTVAAAIHRALLAARERFQAGESDPSALEAAARRVLETAPALSIQYVCVVDETTLSPPPHVQPGNVLAVAVKLGSTRLIDNVVFGAERV